MVFRLTKSSLGTTAGRWNARRSVSRPSPFSLTGSNALVIPRNINFSGTLTVPDSSVLPRLPSCPALSPPKPLGVSARV